MYLCLLSVQGEDCDEFTIQPQDVVAMAGQVAMMRCQYSGVDVEWDKDGTAILPTQEPCDCQVTEDGTLHFNNVSIQDEGEYACVAQIGFSAVRCSAYLRIADGCENRWSGSGDWSGSGHGIIKTATRFTFTVPASMPSISPPKTTKIPTLTNPLSPVLLNAIVALSTLVLVLVVVVVVMVVVMAVVCGLWRNRRGHGRSDNEGEMDLNPAYQTTASLTTNPAYQTTASLIPSTTNPAYAGPPVNIHPPHAYEDVFNCQ